MQNFINILKTELQKPLPGTEIQWQMASSDRMLKNFPRIPGSDAREAAILILLYPHNGSLSTVFMQRPDYDGVHSGQISFPGGKREVSDKNIVQTALRETYEETGVDPSKISVINTLTPLFIPVSNIIVTPVIGWIKERPVFNHQPEEVVFLIEADIKRFLDPSIVKVKPFDIRGEMIEVKYYDYYGNVIWGATAMIMNELLTIIRNSKLKSSWD
ncbi:MAG TPA: CoA pyrophosphatase [Bacteroidales bacterium]|nr:CoA pyrophosphatase [Bacteroidales bacterium]